MPHNPITERARSANATATSATAVPTPLDSQEQAPAFTVPTVVATPSKLQAVEAALAVSTARTATTSARMEAGIKRSQTATDVITGALDDITSANQIIAATNANADLQQQNSTISAIQIGASPDIQKILMQTLLEDENRLEDLLNEQAEGAPTPNPRPGDQRLMIIAESAKPGSLAAFLGAEATARSRTSGRVSDELKNARAQRDATVNRIQGVAAASESFARINALSRKTVNQGTIEANYKAIAAEGRIKGAEAEIQNIQTNAAALTRLAAADSRNVSNLIQSFRLEGEVEERQLTKQRQVLQKEQMAVAREKLKLELPAAKIALERSTLNLEESKALAPERKLAAEAQFASATKRFNDTVTTEDQIVELVQRGQSASGVAIESRELIVHGINQSGDIGAKYARLQEIGGSPDPVVGNTPFEAKESLTLISPTGNFLDTAGIRTLQQISNAQVEKYKALQKVPRDAATLATDFNQTAKEFMDFSAKEIKTGDVTNPYHAPPMSVLEGSAAIQADTLFNKVLKPLQMKEINPQAIIDAAVAGVRSKTVSPEEAAAGIELIFDSAAAYNNTINGGYRRLGLPNQTTYNTSIERPKTTFEELTLFGAGLFALGPLTPLTPINTLNLLSEAKTKNEEGEIISAHQKFLTIDLMDNVKIKEALVKILSANSPTPTVEAAPPTTSPGSTSGVAPAAPVVTDSPSLSF